MRFFLLFFLFALILSEFTPRCFAQQSTDGYGLIAPWETLASTNFNVTPVQQSLQQNVVASPVGLGEPLDPITGLPLRMTSLENSNGTGLVPRIADGTTEVPDPITTPPDLPGMPSTHRSDTARTLPGRMYQQTTPLPAPMLRPDVVTPALPGPPSIIDPFQHNDLHQNGGPIQFDGGIEIPAGGDGFQWPTLPEEPLEKITSLELELARLKSKQKQRSIQQEAFSK